METKENLNELPLTGLADFMSAVIDELQHDRKYSAVHTYRSALLSVLRFWRKTRPDIFEKTIPFIPVAEFFTPGVLKEYQEWLRSRNGSWNTVSTYMRMLRATYNRMFPSAIITYNPRLFSGIYTKVEMLTKRALTQEQMNVLLTADANATASLDVTTRRALDYSRLMFLFCGMPFIDLANLRKQDLHGEDIIYCRHKTGKQITVHITEEARMLFEACRDRNPASSYLFPIMSEAQGGDALKDDAKRHEYYLRKLRIFNRELRKVSACLLPNVKLSSYTPRHTWATLAFHLGTDVGLISEALGHSSVKVTQIYLKPFDNSKINAANKRLINSIVNYDRRMVMP